MMDAFNPEDRVQVTFSNFYALIKQSVKADLMMNGVKNKLDHDAIYTMMTGEHIPEPVQDIEPVLQNIELKAKKESED